MYSFIGLAKKAGAVAAGENPAELAVKRGRACLVIIAGDASHNTVKKFRTAVYGRNIPLVEFGSREQLGHILGKPYYSVVAVTDRGFAERIKEMVDQNHNNDETAYGGGFFEQTKNS